MNRDGHGLKHGCFRKRESVRQVIGDSLRNDDVFSESSVATIVGAGNSEHAAVIAQIDFPANAIPACSARNRGIKCDSIAFRPPGYVRSDGCDSPGSFMTHHNWKGASAGRTVVAVL